MSKTAKLTAYLDGIGLIGPGLDNWLAARPILAGTAPYESRPLTVAAPQSLPPAERRRTGLAIKVALAVAQEACATGQLDARQLAAVFSSSGADNDNCDAHLQGAGFRGPPAFRRPAFTTRCTTPRRVTGASPPGP